MKKHIEQKENLSIIYEIKKVNEELEKAYDNFQDQTDSDLLEASIYRIKELRAKHSYLIKLARENNIEAYYMDFTGLKSVNNA